MIRPKITFVVAARNDDYGGNFLQRMQAFVNNLVSLSREEALNGELTIIEWNPPVAKPALKDALQWPSIPEHFGVRFIIVPNEIHVRHHNSDRMPMFEYLAKNVGIRRACGEFVVATNPDLVFSRELVRFLASSKLDPGCFYRVNRHDVRASVPEDLSVDRQLAFCERQTFRVNTMAGSLPRPHNPFVRFSSDLRHSLGRLRNYFVGYVRGRERAARPRLHTNAAGDFFMMAREHWHTLRAYPELTTHSYIDGYICSLAASLGLRQVILKGRRRIYHQDHDRTEHSSRPTTDYEAYLTTCQAMIAAGKPDVTNDDGWGLGGIELLQIEVHA